MVSAFFEVGCDLRNALAGDVIGFHMDQGEHPPDVMNVGRPDLIA